MAISNVKIDPTLRLDAIASLTDNSGGTASGTIAVIADGATADAVASLNAKLDALFVELRDKGFLKT